MKDPYEEQDFEHAQELVRKRQRYQRRPKKMADVIGRLMARKGYGQQQVSDQLSDAWQAVASESWRDQTRVGLVRRGVLEVFVASSTLNQRLEFEKQNLLTGLQQRLPQVKINDIRFRIGNVNL